MTVFRTGERVVLFSWILLAGALVSSHVAAATVEVPLIEAVKAGDTSTVALLLGTGTDVDVAQSDGATALHWAVFRDQVEIAGLLIDAGADVDAANELGATALSITHDISSARKISDRIAMLYKGKIIWNGPTDTIDDSGDPHVDQFIHGRAEGPIQMELRRL